MKIVFFEVEEWEKPFLEKAFANESVTFVSETLTASTVAKYADAEIISTFIYSTLSKDVLSLLPQLVFIATRSTGFDHIDRDYCREKGILVSNVPSYGVHTVAEHTLTLILALAKKLIPSVDRTKKGDFSLEGLQGFDINGKTLGVIGAGKIGTEVIHLAAAFGMQVLVYTKHPNVSEHLSVKYVDFDTLLGQSDIITLHVPLTDETKHMIDRETLKKCKKGVFLINTARGGLIETESLVEALEEGRVAGAGLDVLEDECDLREERQLLTTKFLQSCNLKNQVLNNILLRRDDVIVTPHNAFHTNEAVKEILDESIKNVQQFIAGSPIHVVEE